ncbi:signal recognition particle subunit SRP72-like [Anneissia japonica]|uniref:signal recognition particle subunit SRP72-like n=1 Tax=Anneissia japonica TaxID=1529436 RepID=UPI00142552D7|nr:signal recognition particle subunit SRP72-like [Anneissia japonica]
MAATGGPSLPQLYSELNKCNQNGDFARALKTTNKILKQFPNEATAFHCKIVCLVQQSQFEQALKEIKGNANLSSGIDFEKAYCLYRLNKIDEALKVIENVKQPGPKLQELLGQVLYRLERYNECLDVYRNLIKNTSDDYDDERETNMSAVIAALQLWNKEEVSDPGLREDTFELCYNKACQLIGQCRYEEALEKLDIAEVLCKEMLEDTEDMTEDEMEGELGVIRVQRGYILQLKGKNEEAMKLYNQVVKSRPADIGLFAVASNNIISLNKDQNVFDSKKKIKSTTTQGLDKKITAVQKSCIKFNTALLQLYTNQYENCRKLLQTLKKEHPDNETVFLIEAALAIREKRPQRAIEILDNYSDSHPDCSSRVKLTSAQLLLMQGHMNQACETLKGLGNDRHRPGIVSLLVSLYTNIEERDTAIEILDEAVEWYQSQRGSQNELNTLLRANTAFKIKNGCSESAIRMLEDLRKTNPGDMQTLAELITAYSKVDPKMAQKLSCDLPPVEALSVDVDALESMPYLRKGLRQDVQEKKETKEEEIAAKKKKRKRKRKLPKNYDPQVNPDPERWLPKHERSQYKFKSKNRQKQNVGKGTQGAAAVDVETSKPPSVPNSPRPGTAATNTAQASPSTSGPRQQKPVQASKKKKKKAKGKGGW